MDLNETIYGSRLGIWINILIQFLTMRRWSKLQISKLFLAFPPIRNFAITFGSGLVYLFLWFRQQMFYVHSSLKVLSNKCLRVFSFAVLVLWILLWISLVFSYLIEVQYKFDFRSGCLAEVGSDMPYFVLVFVWAAASISMQKALLCLFIYPILKRNLWRGH